MHVAEPVQDVPKTEAAFAEDEGARHSGVFPNARSREIKPKQAPREITPKQRKVRFASEPEYPELAHDRNVLNMLAKAEHRETVSSTKSWMKNNRNR